MVSISIHGCHLSNVIKLQSFEWIVQARSSLNSNQNGYEIQFLELAGEEPPHFPGSLAGCFEVDVVLRFAVCADSR